MTDAEKTETTRGLDTTAVSLLSALGVLAALVNRSYARSSLLCVPRSLGWGLVAGLSTGCGNRAGRGVGRSGGFGVF